MIVSSDTEFFAPRAPFRSIMNPVGTALLALTEANIFAYRYPGESARQANWKSARPVL